jgi:riboflavin synthase alpha subunit
MFTGLVETTGEIAAIDRDADGVRLSVTTPLAAELADGDSVAVNGVCLTARGVGGESFSADVMEETLRRSSLGPLSSRCAPATGSAATSSRVTSTVSAASNRSAPTASRASCA